jgi:hypothetical protein
MVQKIRIFQVYYKKEQLKKIAYEPVFNQYCTEYFENTVIRQLILDQKEHLKSEYIGVVSHNLMKKCPDFSHEKLLQVIEKNPEVVILHSKRNHDTIKFAELYHKGFITLFNRLLNKLGLPIIKLETPIYYNHFIARSEIYYNYVQYLLAPAMYHMNGMPEFWGDSKYLKELPEDLVEKWNIKHYPFHPFICERLFSYYVQLNKIPCTYL